MRKLLTCILTSTFILGIGTTNPLASGPERNNVNPPRESNYNYSHINKSYTDTNNDGICDNISTQNNQNKCNNNYIDNDNDGICDNYATYNGKGANQGRSYRKGRNQ